MNKKQKAFERLRAKTIDGFMNLTAKVGIGAKNLLSSSQWVNTGLTANTSKLENMYRFSWLCGIVKGSDCQFNSFHH